MAIPQFSTLASVYPDYWRYPQAEDAQKFVGGEADDKDITNTCTIRMSYAMNVSGVSIPKVWQGITNRRGKNGKYHIIRVANFRPWMVFQFGKPDMDFVKQSGKPFDRTKIEGTEGVIGFEIGGFTDATGHFDLWYQYLFSHEFPDGKDYFTRASRISLWTTGIRHSLAPV
ncbi:MAG TPA: type VI secretion system amidase effector protein Tae4 [Verrucomicrobiales bacterium]|jgi:hypothetical protein|nr:type VI secretion system amidase effector protein Tae4 [Verrucomicrobiales bacterium]